MKIIEVTKKKSRSSEKGSLPADKKKQQKYLYPRWQYGETVEGSKLKKFIDKDHNVYVRSYSERKGKINQILCKALYS